MTIAADEIRAKTTSEARLAAIDWSRVLDDGELLDGTPTLVGIEPVDDPVSLEIKDIAVNNDELTINGNTVIVGQAVQCLISGGNAGTLYTVTLSCDTDSTPAQRIIRSFRIEVTS